MKISGQRGKRRPAVSSWRTKNVMVAWRYGTAPPACSSLGKVQEMHGVVSDVRAWTILCLCTMCMLRYITGVLQPYKVAATRICKTAVRNRRNQI